MDKKNFGLIFMTALVATMLIFDFFEIENLKNEVTTLKSQIYNINNTCEDMRQSDTLILKKTEENKGDIEKIASKQNGMYRRLVFVECELQDLNAELDSFD